MEREDINELCRERFEKWRELLIKEMCLPVCVVGMPLHDPLSAMKVFVLGHTNRVALQIFLQRAADSITTDDDLFVINDED